MIDSFLSQLTWVHGLVGILGVTAPVPFFWQRLVKKQSLIHQLELQLEQHVAQQAQLQHAHKEEQVLAQQLQNEKLQLHGHVQQSQARLSEKQLQAQQFQKLWQQGEKNLKTLQQEKSLIAVELAELKALSEQKQAALEAQLNHLEQTKTQ